MDLSASLHLTPKGADEVKNRTNKLSVRKRSVLLLLDKPHTLEHLLKKTVLHQDEVVEEVQNLLRDGFIATGGFIEGAAAGMNTAMPSSTLGANFQLDPEIIVSEAKFLLIDFCVDSFGTHSEAFCNDIRACNSVMGISSCLTTIIAAAEKQCPGRIPALAKLIAEINETAD